MTVLKQYGVKVWIDDVVVPRAVGARDFRGISKISTPGVCTACELRAGR